MSGERPSEFRKMNGFDIKLLSQKTGIKEATIKKILERHRELQEIPYSFRSGKNRIFLPSIVDWLKKYYGIDQVTKVTTPVTNVTPESKGSIPAGDSINALLKIYSPSELKVRMDFWTGFTPLHNGNPKPPALIAPTLTKDDKAALAIGRNILAKRARREEDSQTQGKLFT